MHADSAGAVQGRKEGKEEGGHNIQLWARESHRGSTFVPFLGHPKLRSKPELGGFSASARTGL